MLNNLHASHTKSYALQSEHKRNKFNYQDPSWKGGNRDHLQFMSFNHRTLATD